MGRRLGHLERDPLQARQDNAAKKQQWRQFSSAVKNKNTECFCSWVRVPEARNWKAPKLWDELQYCERHGKMGVRLGILHRWHRNRATPTIIIDPGDGSDEELFGADGQILAPRARGPAEDERETAWRFAEFAVNPKPISYDPNALPTQLPQTFSRQLAFTQFNPHSIGTEIIVC